MELEEYLSYCFRTWNVVGYQFTDLTLSFFLSSFLQYISSEVNPPSDESDSSSAPSKEQLEQEKQLLLSFKPVMQKFLHDHVDLQVSALYALQVHCYNNNFPKGMCIEMFSKI